MKELRELSKLPTDQAYWVELEARMLERDGGTAGRRNDEKTGWWTPLASRAGALVGLAAAAGIAALLLVPPRTQRAAINPTVLFQLPNDPTMAAFLASPTPPSLASLIASLPRSTP
jgi:hypothetical protein